MADQAAPVIFSQLRPPGLVVSAREGAIVMEFETDDEERGWPIWRPLGGVAAAITALIIVLLVLTQCGGSSVRANPLCAPDAVPKQTVDARRDAATATREAQQNAGRVPTARPVGGPSETPAPSPTMVVPAAPATAPPSTAPGTPGTTATATGAPTTAPSPTAAVPAGDEELEAALVAADGSEAPFFAQNDPQWGGEEYDHSLTAPNGCPGPYLANCGCALTAVTNVLAADGVTSMPDGQALNPSTVNAWASADAQVLNDGSIVSRGFAPGGNVNWNMALAISGGGRTFDVANNQPPQPVVGLEFVGGAGRDQVTADLAEGRPVILSTPRQSHWFTAEGLGSDGGWLFWDPFYTDQVRKGDAFGPASIHYDTDQPDTAVVRRSVVISTRAKNLKVTDRKGQTLPVVQRLSWEDPTCEHDGASDFTLNQVYLPEDAGPVTIEVSDDDPTAIVIHAYGSDGSVKITVHEADGDQKQDYDGGTATPRPSTTATGTPTATPSVTETPSASPIAPSPTSPPPVVTTAPPPTQTPTPTATPDLPGPPANITLSASPPSIPCNNDDYSTITAVVTDARGRFVLDGTRVSFAVVALGSVNPVSASTNNGSASTRARGLSYSTSGVTVVATSGGAEASIRIDCEDSEPPSIGSVAGVPPAIFETDGVYCVPAAGYPITSQLRVTITDITTVAATATYSVGTVPLTTVSLTRETPGGNIYVVTLGPFGTGTLSSAVYMDIRIDAQDAAGNAAFKDADTTILVNDCNPIL